MKNHGYTNPTRIVWCVISGADNKYSYRFCTGSKPTGAYRAGEFVQLTDNETDTKSWHYQEYRNFWPQPSFERQCTMEPR